MTVNSNRAAMSGETIAVPGNLYIPSLDGIRAISFFIVFFAHAGFDRVIPGGFGVTIFFLLSGYLITTLLRLEFKRHQRISLGNFYLRRALRILPPLYVAMALAIGLFALTRSQAEFPFAGTLAQALQISNYYLIFADNATTLPGTGLFWSLAVEEHFYLAFPLLYVWMCARQPAGRQAIVLLALCGAALLWRCALHFVFDAGVNRTYYATDSRFDSILFGCVLAVVANPILNDPLYIRVVRQMKWLLPLCVLVLLGSFLIRSDGFRETLRYTLHGLALMPLFIAAIHYRESAPVRFLNLGFMRFLGVLSYSLYLCHAVFLVTIYEAWKGDPGILVTILSLACSLAFATLVHYGIERPCMKLRKRLSRALQ